MAPAVTVLLTTGTVTSAHVFENRLPEIESENVPLHRFVPLDVPAWVGRFLDHWHPDAVGFLESELWPNILRACWAHAIPTMLINARMSSRSYMFWSRIPLMARILLNHFSRIYARSEQDAVRLRGLGAVCVEVPGDLKLSAEALRADPNTLRDMTVLLHDRPIFLAASTHPGEEVLIQIVHNSLRAKHARLLTIIVPRHPERGPALSQALGAPSRQLGQAPPAEGIWIADTLGELGLWYRLCHVCFVGRSLVAPGGGQNPLEPARLGCPIVTGPFTGNFVDHVALLRQARALEVVNDIHALTHFISHMLADPVSRALMGERAKDAVICSNVIPHEVAQALLNAVFRRESGFRSG
jgi:3-deoxy-D-manno-octulosonic-acid transferase